MHLGSAPGQPDQKGLGIVARDAADLDRLDIFVRGAISSGKLRSIHTKEGPKNAGSTARLVLYRKKDAFIRVPIGGAEEGFELIRLLERDWDGAVAAQRELAALPLKSIANPKLNLCVSMCLDDIYRAVAKIAFNVMAVRLGAEFALRPEFDEIRAYILGDIRHPSPLGRNQVAVDSRFVDQSPDQSVALHTNGHVVALAPVGRSLYALVTLYTRHEFRVRLGEVPLGGFVFSATEFSITRDGYRELSADEIYERIARRSA